MSAPDDINLKPESLPLEGSRDTGEGILISIYPDVCLTPVGGVMVAIPYTIYAYQSDDANTAATVRQTSLRSHTSASIITHCYGDEAGTGGGVTSGTHNGVCEPKTWSSTVRFEGHGAVRHQDEWWMGAVASAATGGLQAAGGQTQSGAALSPASASDAGANAHGAPIAAPNAPPPDAAGQSSAADGHADNLAGGAMGAASSLFDKAFSAATSAAPAAMIAAGGAPMASAGSSLLGQLGSMVGGGVLNQLIGMMHNKNVGVASTEQIGTAKILSVGQVMMETIGHTRTISVGDQLTIEVGKSKLIMNKEGHVVLLGTQFHFEASGPVLVRGKVIDHNP
jgi:hypothetical protein